MNAKKAFTLIELLVVIAIIAILAAILFPVFAQAKAAAKKTAALSSIKQTGTAIAIYQGDSDDVYPYAQDNGWYDTWVISTAPYIKSVPLTRDPSDDRVTSRPGWPQAFKDDKNTYELSFAANGLVKWNGSANQMFGVMGMDQSWIQGTTMSSTAVTQPSNTIALAVRYGSASRQFPFFWLNNDGGSYWEDYGWCGAIPNGTRDGKPYTHTPAQGQPDAGKPIIDNKDNRNGCVSTGPYGDKAVFSMADTSARVMNPSSTNPQTGADDTAKQSKNMWNALRQ